MHGWHPDTLVCKPCNNPPLPLYWQWAIWLQSENEQNWQSLYLDATILANWLPYGTQTSEALAMPKTKYDNQFYLCADTPNPNAAIATFDY